jgi:hypothetical protein
MNFFRWVWWVLTWRPRVRVVEVDGRTRLLRAARTEVYGGIKVRWAEQEDDKC